MFHLNRISRQIPKKPLEQDEYIGLLCLSCKYILTASGFQGTVTLLQRVESARGTTATWTAVLLHHAHHSSWTLMVPRLSVHSPRASWGAVSSQLLLELISARPNICKENFLDAYSQEAWLLPHFLNAPPHPEGKNISRISIYSSIFFSQAVLESQSSHRIFLLLFSTVFFPPHTIFLLLFHTIFFLL